MKKTEFQKRVQELRNQQEIESFEASLTRARSISVGTSFGGTTEVMMRADGGKHLWCAMQPVEVTELIHQLAANIGCHIALKPRDDFSSWREWRVSEAEKKHLGNHVPFVNDMADFQQLGASNFNQAAVEAKIENEVAQKEYEYVNGAAVKAQKKRGIKHDDTVATKKTVNRRSAK
jgi:hypothetical protein